MIIALSDVNTWDTSLSLMEDKESKSKKAEDGAIGNEKKCSLSIRQNSIALVDDNGEELYDLAHKFAEHTYRSPTNCDICHGLLVGLWSQGLQCEKCGVNCHRGEGIGDHDDCLAEAMLAPCGCVQPKSSKADDSPREKTKVRTAGGKSNSEMVYARQLMF